MWGAQEKSEGHIKKFSAGALRRHCAPHLQIASDATATDRLPIHYYALCDRGQTFVLPQCNDTNVMYCFINQCLFKLFYHCGLSLQFFYRHARQLRVISLVQYCMCTASNERAYCKFAWLVCLLDTSGQCVPGASLAVNSRRTTAHASHRPEDVIRRHRCQGNSCSSRRQHCLGFCRGRSHGHVQ